jgi:hypothetical protein
VGGDKRDRSLAALEQRDQLSWLISWDEPGLGEHVGHDAQAEEHAARTDHQQPAAADLVDE